MRISDWSSDVCSSDLRRLARPIGGRAIAARGVRLREAEQPLVIAEHLALLLDLVEQLDPSGEHAQTGTRLRRAPTPFAPLGPGSAHGIGDGRDRCPATLAPPIERRLKSEKPRVGKRCG